MQSYDVITIGGATLDIFVHIDEHSKECCAKSDESGEWFCLRRGGKIPADTLEYGVGGNAANVAVGLARLGLHTATYIHYGGDELSEKITTTLTNEGVGTEYIVKDPHETSPIGIAINYQGERTLFVHHIVRDHTLPDIAVPVWIYLTSVGERWQELYKQVVDFVKKNNVKLACNPGTHQFERGVESFIEQVKASDILFVNKEEATKIFNFQFSSLAARRAIFSETSEGERMKELLVKLQSMGPKIVSVTDGEKGSYAIDKNGDMFALGPTKTVPIERTGAGDAYASGFLGAIIAGKDVPEAMSWGMFNASSVIGKVGAETGLLIRDAISAKRSEMPSVHTL